MQALHPNTGPRAFRCDTTVSKSLRSYELSALKQKVLQYVKDWRKRLYMDDWAIAVRFDLHGVADYADAICDAEDAPEYREGTIRFNLRLFSKSDAPLLSLEAAVVHELLELELWQLKEVGTSEHKKKTGETTIQHLSRCLVSLRYGVDYNDIELLAKGRR